MIYSPECGSATWTLRLSRSVSVHPSKQWNQFPVSYLWNYLCFIPLYSTVPNQKVFQYLQGAYKLSEYFAKPYLHKYWTEIHDVTTIWKRNVCSFIVTLNAFDVRSTCDTADVQAILPFGGNGSIAWTSAVSHVGRTSNAFKVSMKLQTFLFQMVVTSCISVQYLWKYGFVKSSDNLYKPCMLWYESANVGLVGI